MLEGIREDECLFANTEGDTDVFLGFVNLSDRTFSECFVQNNGAIGYRFNYAIKQQCFKSRRNQNESSNVSSGGDSLGVVVGESCYKNQGSPDPCLG